MVRGLVRWITGLLVCALLVLGGALLWALKPLPDPRAPEWPLLSALLVFEFRCDTALALLDVAHDTWHKDIGERLGELEKFQHHCNTRPPGRPLTGLAQAYRKKYNLPTDEWSRVQALQRNWRPGWGGQFAARSQIFAGMSAAYHKSRDQAPGWQGIYQASMAGLDYGRCNFALVEGPGAVHYRIRRFLSAVEWQDHPRNMLIEDWEARHKECGIPSGLPVKVDVSFYDRTLDQQNSMHEGLETCLADDVCAAAFKAAPQLSYAE